VSLTENNVDTIRQMIEQSRISHGTIKDDILDHLCCAVECRIAEGKNFETAFAQSLHEFSPLGLDEIEKETYLLLNPKILFMKKLMYGSGLIFSIMVAVGLLLKVLHLTGSNELMLVGMVGFVIVYLPLVLKTRAGRQTPISPMERTRDVLGFISAFILSAGGILKIMGAVGANETLLLGTGIFSFGFLPFLFLRMYRESVA
jgi:hypothetical protein